MKKVLIITAIILVLIWIFRKKNSSASGSGTENNGTGTGSGTGSGSGSGTDPSEYTTRPANTKPMEGLYIVNPIFEPTKPAAEDPAVNVSPSVFPKPGTAEVSPLLQNLSAKK